MSRDKRGHDSERRDRPREVSLNGSARRDGIFSRTQSIRTGGSQGEPTMTSESGPFLLPDRLEPVLERVMAYWNGLKRGENDIPFWDDVKFSTLEQVCRDVMMVGAFEAPLRFRFDLVGEDLTRRYGAAIAGKFTDEIDLHTPIDRLTDQCRATVEQRAPTWFQREAADGAGYSRLVLPLWGNGHIEMLIGAVCFS
jgi:hypothetical protein